MTTHAHANDLLNEIRAAKSTDDLDQFAAKRRNQIALMEQSKEVGVRVIHIRNLWKLRYDQLKWGL